MLCHMTLTIFYSVKTAYWEIFEISLVMHNWGSIENAKKKNLLCWHLSTEAKWKIYGAALHKSD